MEQKSEGNFVEILKKALVEIPEGKIEFLGPTEGSVSVIFIQGEIFFVESTWGTGNDELQRIYEWETGSYRIKNLSAEEKRTLETTWQKPVILNAAKKETKSSFSWEQPVKVQTLLQNIKRESIDLDAFLDELEEEKYSGELRSTTPAGNYRVLFYQGVPLLSSDRNNPPLQEVREQMDIPQATLNFYLLGDELAHAFLSVIHGEKLWEGLSITVFHLDKMLDKLTEKNPTGHLCIRKENGDRHYCFFFQGVPLGIYDIEKQWSPVDPDTIWEGAQHVDYYLSGTIESFLSQAVTVVTVKDVRDFISSWNDFIEGIAKKLGKKPVEKSLQKGFGGMDVYALEGSRLLLVGGTEQNVDAAVTAFREKVPGFLKEMEVIVGSHWLNGHLQAFRERHGDIIEQVSLTEVFSP